MLLSPGSPVSQTGKFSFNKPAAASSSAGTTGASGAVGSRGVPSLSQYHDAAQAGSAAVLKTMVWQKVQSAGYKPSAREGHTLVSAGSKVFVFGGVETGRRVNSVQVLDVLTGQWSAHAVGNASREKEAIVCLDATSEDEISLVRGVGVAGAIDTQGSADADWEVRMDSTQVPSPRSQHAACALKFIPPVAVAVAVAGAGAGAPAKGRQQIGVDTASSEREEVCLMLVHGGEGVKFPTPTPTPTLISNPAQTGASSGAGTGPTADTGKGKGKGKGKAEKVQAAADASSDEDEEQQRIDRLKAQSEGEGGGHATTQGPAGSAAAAAPTGSGIKHAESKTTGGGICVGDSLLQFAHPTGGVRVVGASKQRLASSSAANGGGGGADETGKNISSSSTNVNAAAYDQALALQLQTLVTFEDLFSLNLKTGEWVRLHSMMAPLARRGHTMSTGIVNVFPAAAAAASSSGVGVGGGRDAERHQHQHQRDRNPHIVTPVPQECVIMFGGYLRESHSYSNTVHVCTTSGVAEAVSNPSKNTSTASPIHWRVLACTGTPPPPRYRHSATVVRTAGYMHSLIVCGGLGKGNTPLNDVYALNLYTLKWTRIVGDPYAVYNGISEPGPATWPEPLFGHSAFAIQSLGGDEVLPELNEDEQAEDATGKFRTGGHGSPGHKQRRPVPATDSSNQAKSMAATAASAAATQQLLLLRANSADADVLPIDAEWEEMLVIFGGSGIAPAAEQSSQQQQQQRGRRHDDVGEVLDYVDKAPHPNAAGTGRPRAEAKSSDEHQHQHQHDHHTHKIGEVFDIPDSDDESANENGNGGDGKGISAFNADDKKYSRSGNKGATHSAKLSMQQRAAADAATGCRQDTLVLDVRRGMWRKIQGSIVNPTKRTNHAACMIEGWAPGNPAVSAASVNASSVNTKVTTTGQLGGRTLSSAALNAAPQVDEDRSSTATSSSSSRSFAFLSPSVTTTAYVNDRYFSKGDMRCGAVFGGSSTESMCSPEMWLLDLQWRWPGVSGFDENAETRTNAFMRNENAWSTHRATSPTMGTMGTVGIAENTMAAMKASASMPAGLGMGFTTTTTTAAATTTATTSSSSSSLLASEKVISKAFQKLKKERAHAEQLIVKEADKNSWYKEELERTQAELAQARQELKAAKVVKMPDQKLHDRIAQLTSELQASLEREKGLAELNNEAHRLLLLVGVKDFKERIGQVK